VTARACFASTGRTRYTRAMRLDLLRFALPVVLLVPLASLACVEEQKQAPQQQAAPPPPEQPAQAPVSPKKFQGIPIKKGIGMPQGIGVGQGPTATPPPPPPSAGSN
jgi:hypothetical protein